MNMNIKKKIFEDSWEALPDGSWAQIANIGPYVKKIAFLTKELNDTVGKLKGYVLELILAKNIHSYLGNNFKGIKLLDPSHLSNDLYSALENGKISEEELQDVLYTDIIAKGKIKNTNEEVKIIIIEVSYIIDEKDVERAIRRAEILRKAFEVKTVPVVAGTDITQRTKELVKEKGVLELYIKE